MKIFRDFWKNASFAYSCAPFLSSSRLPEHSWYKVLINLIIFLTLREKWEICKHCFCRHHLLPSPVFVFVFEGTIYSHLLYLYLYLQAPSTPLSCICMHFCKTVYSTLLYLYLYLYLYLQAQSSPLSWTNSSHTWSLPFPPYWVCMFTWVIWKRTGAFVSNLKQSGMAPKTQ